MRAELTREYRPYLYQRTLLYKTHKTRWHNCTDCTLAPHRTKVVLHRGTLPCQILFIGEAPGPDEDWRGQPFVGKAGKTFDLALTKYVTPKLPSSFRNFTYAITNVVACFPRNTDPDSPSSFREPYPSEIAACSPRLLEYIHRVARPEGIITLGQVSASSLPPTPKGTHEIPTHNIYHPSYIMRMGGPKNSRVWFRYIQDMTNAITSILQP